MCGPALVLDSTPGLAGIPPITVALMNSSISSMPARGEAVIGALDRVPALYNSFLGTCLE